MSRSINASFLEASVAIDGQADMCRLAHPAEAYGTNGGPHVLG
jgi:hypothetical protein